MFSLNPVQVALILLLSCTNTNTLAMADPMITHAAAALVPRATDPSLVGYISRSGTFTDARSCDYPQTVSTSGSYVQCCPTTGSCPFYTSCSSNTLLGAGVTVPCDVNTALTCNTAIVLATTGANSGPSYLACWQTSLGTSPFTFVRDIGGASAAAPTGSTSAAVSGASASTQNPFSFGSGSGSATASASAASTMASSSSSRAVAPGGSEVGVGGGVVGGLLALLAQILL